MWRIDCHIVIRSSTILVPLECLEFSVNKKSDKVDFNSKRDWRKKIKANCQNIIKSKWNGFGWNVC